MKLLPFLLLLLLPSVTLNLAEVRREYISAATSETSAGSFHRRFEAVGDSHANTTLVAYKAASMILMAKYEKGLLSKKRLFDKGTDLLDATIEKDKDNFEARLIRLNIQEHVPWIAGYRGCLKEDKAFLLKNYATQPADLKAFAKAYIQQSEVFTERERKEVR